MNNEVPQEVLDKIAAAEYTVLPPMLPGSIPPLVLYPDKRLKQVCKPVETIDSLPENLFLNLEKVMHARMAAGVAAPQIGHFIRAFIFRDEKGRIHRVINPIMEVITEDKFKATEGCLSIDDVWIETTRPAKIRLSWISHNGSHCMEEFAEHESTAIQHEMDHLNGILITDLVSKLKRDLLLKKAAKRRRFSSDRKPNSNR